MYSRRSTGLVNVSFVNNVLRLLGSQPRQQDHISVRHSGNDHFRLAIFAMWNINLVVGQSILTDNIQLILADWLYVAGCFRSRIFASRLQSHDNTAIHNLHSDFAISHSQLIYWEWSQPRKNNCFYVLINTTISLRIILSNIAKCYKFVNLQVWKLRSNLLCP